MSPHAVFCSLLADGITLKLSVDCTSLVVPAGTLSPEQRAIVLLNKPALVAFLIQTKDTSARLIKAAMSCCDQYGDGEPQREAMRLDCLMTPPHMQPDLLEHFKQTYGKKP